MQRASRQVERARIHEQKTALPRRDHGQFGEAYVVAYRDPHPAVPREVYDRDFIPRAQCVGLPEGDFAGDVDVEQVDLAVGGEERTRRSEGQRRVVVLLRATRVLWYAAADQIGVGLARERG